MQVTQAGLPGDTIQSSTPKTFTVTGAVRQANNITCDPSICNVSAPPLLLLGNSGNCNTDGVLTQEGSGAITIQSGNALGDPFVNSCSSGGVSLQDKGFSSPDPILMPAQPTPGGCTGTHCGDTTIRNTTTAYPDPYAAVLAPTAAQCATTLSAKTITTSDLKPGINCYFGNKTLTLGNINIQGAMIYLAQNATLAITGNVVITPPASGNWAGLALMWRPTSPSSPSDCGAKNPPYSCVNITHATWSSPTGVFYAPGMALSLGPGGTGGGNPTSFTAGQAIIYSIDDQDGTVIVG
jgi:hypothetical protein